MRVHVQGRVCALLLEFEALPAVVGDNLDAELRAASAEDLLEVLPRKGVESDWPILAICFPGEVRVERLGLHAYAAADVIRRKLVDVGLDFSEGLRPIVAYPHPGALDRDLEA